MASARSTVKRLLVSPAAGGVRCLATSAARQSAGAPPAPKYYELRTYDIKQSKWDEFVRLTTEKIHMRFAASKCNVYLCADPGPEPRRRPFNEVTHIWEYDDLVQRAGVRKSLGSDKQWLADYLLPMLDTAAAHQSNSVMLPAPWWPLRPSTDGRNHFAVRKTQLHPGKTGAWSEAVKDELAGEGDNAPLGVWVTDIGDLDSVHELYSYPSHTALVEHQQHRDREAVKFDGTLIKERRWSAYVLAPWSTWSV
ncbi:protein NipSnap homolog 3A-like [Sycon ciliatum]|uniref:protein NipSnap homolog 3A-like n=1 Tax=Sycon ciliatum TaxID=27933 RepID=UPI0020AB28BD|eukprot:scpid78092/ scgid15094/ Protein NipSnap homolog 3A; Protein NipSnap homolog 4; Target for Salmonella secreted protein C